MNSVAASGLLAVPSRPNFAGVEATIGLEGAKHKVNGT
jgi:hypothetical protein